MPSLKKHAAAIDCVPSLREVYHNVPHRTQHMSPYMHIAPYKKVPISPVFAYISATFSTKNTEVLCLVRMRSPVRVRVTAPTFEVQNRKVLNLFPFSQNFSHPFLASLFSHFGKLYHSCTQHFSPLMHINVLFRRNSESFFNFFCCFRVARSGAIVRVNLHCHVRCAVSHQILNLLEI